MRNGSGQDLDSDHEILIPSYDFTAIVPPAQDVSGRRSLRRSLPLVLDDLNLACPTLDSFPFCGWTREMAELVCQRRKSFLLHLDLVQNTRHFHRPLLKCVELMLQLADLSTCITREVSNASRCRHVRPTFSSHPSVTSSVGSLHGALQCVSSGFARLELPVMSKGRTDTSPLARVCSYLRHVQMVSYSLPKLARGRQNWMHLEPHGRH